ncbi:MAG: hypothetical protein IPJ27_07720 [Candidatus Accumulibacter sp.]|uniref:Uncharacterized protein n=1 Tax=Candidatus Accumulibacter proximus TaxID=2954385 RepID=A0A935PYI5_9PROT|nr:hypothetical protein [Candidatus Accumulibacter proximus]
MKNCTSVRFSEDDLGLDALTTIVQQGEQRLGPLLAISPCEDFPPNRLNCFTHESPGAPAAAFAAIELRLCSGGNIPQIPGKTLVCLGDCFVDSQLRLVAAFR